MEWAVGEELREDTESFEPLGELLSMLALAKRISWSYSDGGAGSRHHKIHHCKTRIIYENTRQPEVELAKFVM